MTKPRSSLRSALVVMAIAMTGAVPGVLIGGAIHDSLPRWELVATFHAFADGERVLDSDLTAGQCGRRANDLASRTGYMVSFACKPEA